MPRVAINKKQYLKTDLCEWIHGRMKRLNLKQKDMGEILGISQQAFGDRLRESNFSVEQMYEIFKQLQATDEEILRLMKL